MDHPADEATVDAIGTKQRQGEKGGQITPLGRRSSTAENDVPPKTYSEGGQCDIITGTVIDARMPRVTPPRMNSRRRECP